MKIPPEHDRENCFCEIDPEECNCDCHKFEGIEHCVPCCYTCEFCGRHIEMLYYEEHSARCLNKQSDHALMSLPILLMELKRLRLQKEKQEREGKENV